MKIDRFVNWFLTLIFGTRDDGDRRLWLHSQNLNEKKNDETGLPYYGRLWVNSNFKTFRRLLRFEWNLWSKSCGISVEADSEDGGTVFHIALPPFSFWLALPIGFKEYDYTHHVYFDIDIHHWALWWQFGGDSMSWDSRTPKWKHGTFHFDDFVLGKMKYTNELVGEPKDVMIPMPEGEYPSKMQLERSTWRRPRWPFATVKVGYKIDIPRGIPHQGKGENSWDCGEDGLFGCWSEGDSIRNAITAVQESVLKSRRRYDGNMMAKYPDPALRDYKPVDNSDLNALLAQAGKGPTPAT